MDTDNLELEATPLNPEIYSPSEAKFTAEEEITIRDCAKLIYTEKDNTIKSEAAQKAREDLERMGCDLTRADNLVSEVDGAEGYAEQVIMAGKLIKYGAMPKESNGGEEVPLIPEVNTDEQLIVSKSLMKGATLEVKTAKSVLKIRPEESSPTGLVAEMYTELGAKVDTIELEMGNNTITRHGIENDIRITIPAVSEDATIVEISQVGASLKDRNEQ